MNRIGKIKLGVFIFLRITVAMAAIFFAIDEEWTNFAYSILVLFVFFLPSIIAKRLKLDLSYEFEIVVILFIYAALFLGEVQSFYNRFWWWDIMLHSSSGFVIGAVGFSLVDILNENEKIAINLSPVFVAVFSFSFAMAIGVLWEIYEFFMDSIFGMNMQKSGLIDTMWDLIVDAGGAFVFSVLGYFQLKGKIRFLKKFISKYENEKTNMEETKIN